MAINNPAALPALIEGNRAIIARASALNRRAGAQVFPVMDRKALAAWLMPRLAGARRCAEVTDLEALRLPPLDAVEVVRVELECPDTIEVLSEHLEVRYTDDFGSACCRVTLKDELASRWAELGNDGYVLPGGRAVELVVVMKYYERARSTSIPVLKEQMRGHLNQSQWDTWERPEIEAPDASDFDSVVPFEVAKYGTCTVTGEPLLAYGTMRSCWSGFETVWFRSNAEAQNVADETADKLCDLYDEAEERRERDTYSAASERIRNVYNNTAVSELGEELRSELYRAQYDSHPHGLEQTRERTASLAELAERADAAIAQIEAQRELERVAEEARRAEIARHAEQRIELVIDACASLRCISEAPDADRLSGYVDNDYGFSLNHNHVFGESETWIDERGEFAAYCDARKAQVIEAVACAGGVLEVLAYEKYGGWNFNLRWRKLGEGETAPNQARTATQSKLAPATDVFTHVSGRDFRCPEGHGARLTGGQNRSYKRGEAVEISCTICSARGTVQSSDAKKAEPQIGKLDLSALANKFGR